MKRPRPAKRARKPGKAARAQIPAKKKKAPPRASQAASDAFQGVDRTTGPQSVPQLLRMPGDWNGWKRTDPRQPGTDSPQGCALRQQLAGLNAHMAAAGGLDANGGSVDLLMASIGGGPGAPGYPEAVGHHVEGGIGDLVLDEKVERAERLARLLDEGAPASDAEGLRVAAQTQAGTDAFSALLNRGGEKQAPAAEQVPEVADPWEWEADAND